MGIFDIGGLDFMIEFVTRLFVHWGDQELLRLMKSLQQSGRLRFFKQNRPACWLRLNRFGFWRVLGCDRDLGLSCDGSLHLFGCVFGCFQPNPLQLLGEV